MSRNEGVIVGEKREKRGEGESQGGRRRREAKRVLRMGDRMMGKKGKFTLFSIGALRQAFMQM